MQDLTTTKFSEEFLALCGMGIGLTAVIGGIVVAVAAIVAIHLRRSRRDEMDATLKIEMIERGMSAEDIERVLKAQSPDFVPYDYRRRFDRSCKHRSSVG